jgi:hypothetical protein
VPGVPVQTVVCCTPISPYPLPRYVITHMNKSAPPFYHTDADIYRGADKSLARPTFQCILFDGGNISFDASLVIYIYIYIYIY